GVVLNPLTGAVTVAPGTAPGVYTLTYQICEIATPSDCDTALVTVTVTAVIDAVADSGSANSVSGGTAVANVLVNDTLNGVPATLATVLLTETIPSGNAGVVLNPLTGAVTVAPGTAPGVYTLTYQICEIATPSDCDTALVTVTVTAVIDAVADSGSANSVSGGTAVANVLVNDTLNGVPATLATVLLTETIPSGNAGVVLNPLTGAVTVAPGTAPGVYTLTYQICEIATPSNCDTALVTVTVTAVIDAVADSGSANSVSGGTAVANVLVNDTLNGVPATLATVLLTETIPSGNAGVVLNPLTGAVTVAPGTAPGVYTLTYQICEIATPSDCDTALVTVTVTAVIDAVADSGSANSVSGGTAVANVLVNDTLNGVPATLATVLLTETIPSGNAGVVLNPLTGAVTVAPGTAPGVYTLTYQICEIATPSNCDTALVTVTVTAVIDAVADSGSANSVSGGTAVANVLVNDTLNGVPATLATVLLTETIPSGNAGVVLNPLTGAVTVAPGTAPGVYTLTYQICEIATPSDCDTALVTVTVTAVIDAVADSGSANSVSGGTAVANVLVNDTLNGVPATLATVLLTETIPSGNAGVVLNPLTGAVTVAPGTAPGVYTLTYQICEIATPSDCDTALVTVTVTAVIDAVADSGSANSVSGGTAVANVLVNDTLNGVPATLATVLLTETIPSGNAGVVLNPLTGAVTVAPGTAPGVYTLTYQICEIATPSDCDTALVTVTVTAVIDAVADSGSANSVSGGTAVANVLVNDTLNGVPATLATVLLTETIPSGNAGVVLNPLTGAVTVAPGTAPGVYTLTYQICEIATPSNCDTALVTVTVTAVIDAVADSGSANSVSGGTAVANVLVNDTLNGGPATLANVLLTETIPSGNAGVVLNPLTGAVTVAPGTAPGVYTLTYQICEIATPSNCDTALVTVTVTAVIDAVADSGSANSVSGGTAVANVLVNDTLNGVPATLATVLLTETIPSGNAGVVLNPLTGAVTVAPGTAPGVYTLTYQICEIATPSNCDTALVTVTVTAVIDAVADSGSANSVSGGTAVANVLVNDTLNGVPATLATVLLTETIPSG